MTDLQRPAEAASGRPERILAVRTKTLTRDRLEELRERIRAGAPWLTDADEPLLRSALGSVLALEEIDEYLVRVQTLDSRGRPRTVMTKTRWAVQNIVMRQLEELGLTPASRAEIGRLDRDGTSPAERKRRQHRLAAAARARTEAARAAAAQRSDGSSDVGKGEGRER